MKSSKLSNGENRMALRQLLQNRKLRHLWRYNLGSRWKLQKNGSREFQYWCVLQYNQKSVSERIKADLSQIQYCAGQTDIWSSRQMHGYLFMALCNRADHYIFALWFLSFFFFLFLPRLISAVRDWMSTILPVHTWCGFRANLECTSEMCCTGRKKSPFWHHRTTLSGCIFAAEACIDNPKKNC